MSPIIGTDRCGKAFSRTHAPAVRARWPASPSQSSEGARRNQPSTRDQSPWRSGSAPGPTPRASAHRCCRSWRSSHSSRRARTRSESHGFFRQSQPICSTHQRTSGKAVGPGACGSSGCGMRIGWPEGP